MNDNTPLGNRTKLEDNTPFRFACNDTIPCFTRCCRDADMFLYPYDIIRLKKHLGISSDEFLVQHTVTAFRDNPHFPSVMLKMSDADGHPCSFLTEQGCTVYENRPYSCRAYPLEPAMAGDEKGHVSISCFLVRHDHCKGHGEGKEWTPEALMKDQGMDIYNQYNSAWARVAALLFSPNTFGAQGADNPAMNMAFMAAYNVDTFRRFVFESSFLKKYKVPKKRLKLIKTNDVELMRLGFDWILRFLGGQGPLREKQ
ncbi:MAG TPA: YkgJ family cysteine cluster protein [Desulfobacteraceae bacterium]|mgnify:CR=1 FL=1|nr:YkgJ family cysteine cluster protein [Desulfobacteraceae bacterium]